MEGSNLCLVGQFLTDQPINPNIMNRRMADLWKPKKRRSNLGYWGRTIFVPILPSAGLGEDFGDKPMVVWHTSGNIASSEKRRNPP